MTKTIPPAASTDPTPATAPKPTVGRIVHYRLTEADAALADAKRGRKNVLKAGAIRPALVEEVHNDACVDLDIIIGGEMVFKTSVMLGAVEGAWDWPPRA